MRTTLCVPATPSYRRSRAMSRRISPAQALAELFADDDSGDDWLLDQFDDGQEGDDGEDGEGHDGDDDDDAGGGDVGGGPDGVRVQNGGRGGGVGEGGNGDTEGHSGEESDDGVSDGGGDHGGDEEQFADKSHRAADEVLPQGDDGDDGEHFFLFPHMVHNFWIVRKQYLPYAF